ncbi:MAG TPA: septal ring lytic transglycosylase RlpA family protein [Methyloceanibacter sp.]|jgi:rare lipoprotein A|nr:septal ring lytic transglycosylase RlpA family protein [Methyloceanibacter sp.]
MSHVLFCIFMLMLFMLMLLTSYASAEQVIATWYGDEFRGKRTASGQIFNPAGHTAAHRSLPFGTCLVVRNPRTGREVRVTVNDRGPFAHGASLDLSWGAARAIGMRSTQALSMRRC